MYPSKLNLAVPAAATFGAAQEWDGGWGTVFFVGSTWASATLKLQAKPPGSTRYLGVTDEFGAAIELVANGYRNFTLAGPVDLRVGSSGSTGTTAVDCCLLAGWAETRGKTRAL